MSGDWIVSLKEFKIFHLAKNNSKKRARLTLARLTGWQPVYVSWYPMLVRLSFEVCIPSCNCYLAQVDYQNFFAASSCASQTHAFSLNLIHAAEHVIKQFFCKPARQNKDAFCSNFMIFHLIRDKTCRNISEVENRFKQKSGKLISLHLIAEN